MTTDAVKLPPVLVTAPKLRLPAAAEALSRAEFAARLRRQYPGASIPGQDPFRIEHGAPNYARLQYENDRRAEQVNAVRDIADLTAQAGDRAQAQRLRKALQQTPASTYKDPLLEAMDKSVNGGRR